MSNPTSYPKISDLGLLDYQLEIVERLLGNVHGLMVMAGPPESGKTDRVVHAAAAFGRGASAGCEY